MMRVVGRLGDEHDDGGGTRAGIGVCVCVQAREDEERGTSEGTREREDGCWTGS